MKVEVISSWCHPVNGRIIPNGTKLTIDARHFNAEFLKELKAKKKTTKKDK